MSTSFEGYGQLSELIDLIQRLEIPPDDCVQALLGAVSPIQPPALRQGWRNSKRYGNDAPSTQEIWKLQVDADFRCTLCGSQRRITIDHIDNNPKNHSVDNLRILCAACNRADNSKATRDRNHQLRIYRAAISLFDELGTFPTDKQVLQRAGTEQIGGATYMLRYLEKRLT